MQMPMRCPQHRPYAPAVETGRHIELLAREGGRMVELGRGADLDVVVPNCPEWSVAALLRHVAELLTWSTELVQTGRLEAALPGSIGAPVPAADAEVPDFLDAALRLAIDTFSGADPAAPVWGWAGDHRARFWPRRMLFEVTVHLGDLQGALGVDATLDTEVASEGIDEHLSNIPWMFWDPGVRALSGAFDSVGLRATDGPSWRMILMPGGMFWDRSDEPTTATVEGTVTDLYLHTQGRATAVQISGDVDFHARTLGALSF